MPVLEFDTKEIGSNPETLFCEGLQTFGTRIAVLKASADFPSDRQADGTLQNRMYNSRPGYLMPRGPVKLSFDVEWSGALVDTQSGALAHTWLTQLLADGLGGGDITEVGGLAGASATTTSLPSATGTRTRGAVIRVGKLGDGAALGQAAVVGNPTTSLLTALPAAPGAADVVRSAIMVYPTETLGPTKRFLMGWNSAVNPNAQFAFHGCQLNNLTININHGQVPYLTLDYLCAYWRDLTGFTVPSGTVESDCKGAMSGAGSYFLNTVGTTARVLVPASEIKLSLNLGLVPRTGQGGNFALQHIIGFERVVTQDIAATLFTIPPDQTKVTDYDSDGSDSIFKHLLACLSAGGGAAASEGRHVGFYAPQMFPIGPRPNATNWNKLAMQTVMYGLAEGPDTTNDLTRSAFRLYFS